MVQQFKVIFLLIQYIFAQVPIDGCLKMNDSGKCEFCDFQNGYKLTGDGLCDSHQEQNCQLQSLTGTCIKCNQGYYIDSITFKCVQMNQGQLVENCIEYDQNQQCMKCESNFYLSNNTCSSVENAIQNCQYYQSKTKCLECQQGYAISTDYSQCSIIKDKENCSGYGRVACEICDTGYTKNLSYYQFYFLEDIKNSVYNEMVRQDQNKLLVKEAPSCQKIEIQNCKDLKNYKECWECEQGYILNEESLNCDPYPNNVIFNCEIYGKIDKCQQCKNGYHLTSTFECTQNEEVIGCITFDGTQNKTVCQLCQQDYYLLNEKNCSIRTRSNIDKCISYPINQDRCQQCETGYEITSDGLKCLSSLSNCIEYIISSENTKFHECLTCGANYYIQYNDLNRKICAPSKNQKCELLQNLSDQCRICETKFYLNPDDQKCYNHINIQDCDIYSQDKRNECKQCNNVSIDFQIHNYCVQTEEIQNCLQYNKDGCTLCEQGYEVVIGLTKLLCQKIQIPENCLIKGCSYDLIGCPNIENCTKCQQGYVKIPFLKDNQELFGCEKPPVYVTENCIDNNISGGKTLYQDAQCYKCKENHVPLLNKDSFVCLDQYYVQQQFIKNDQEFSNILNCRKIYKNSDSTQHYCKNCKKGYIEQNGCIPENSCTGTKVIFEQFPTNVNYISNQKIYTCQSSANQVANCNILAPFYFVNPQLADFSNPQNYLKCIKCKTDFYMAIELNQLSSYIINVGSNLPKEFVTNYDPEKLNFDNFNTNSPVYYRYPATLCIQPEQIIDNCEQYIKVTIAFIDHYFCAKCKHQYTGNLVYNSLFSNYVIQSCSQLNQCTTKKHIGLPGFLNFLLSCHECQENKIPYLNTQSSDPNQWISPKLSELYKSGDSQTVECFDNSNKILPDNCVVAIKWKNGVSVDYSDSNKSVGINREKIAIFCASCKPGFRVKEGMDIGQSLIMLYVGKCEQIDQCLQSEWANNCSQCEQNYSYPIQQNKISYDRCIYSNQSFCYAYDESQQKCKICKKGYSFNYDNICELISPPRCKEHYSQMFFQFDQPSLYFHMYTLEQGCNNCEEDYYPIQPFDGNFITCSNSEYMQQGMFTVDTKYIQNCIVYSQNQGHLVCQKCSNGYVLSYIKHKCIKNTFLDGCVTALSDKKCYKCQQTHVIVNHVCEQKKIANCQQYLEDVFAYQQVCIQCASGFYLDNNQCSEGFVEFCDQYEGEKLKCQKCKQGYQKIDNKQGHYCLKIDPRSNCVESYDNELINQKILQCTSCDVGKPLILFRQEFSTWLDVTQKNGFKLSEDLKTFCFQLNKIENCLKYDNNQSFQDSSFGCTLCESGYYTDGVHCHKQLNVDENCSQMAKDKDQCEICKQGYFLDSNQKCSLNPVGIPGCRAYKSQSQCSQCSQNMYVQNNQCLELSQSEKVENCLYHESPNNCQECIKGFIVQNFQCVQGLAKNCLTYSDKDNCLTCPENYIKVNSEGKINCIYKTDQNCSKLDNESMKCIECINGYFINELGQCQDILVNIKYCDIYESKNTCKYCQKGYVLSVDKQLCENDFEISKYLDPNCQNAYQVQQLDCQICSPGYYMKNLEDGSECAKCEAKNCFYCDPFKPFNCNLCNLGYIMNNDKDCQEKIYEQQVDNEQQQNTENRKNILKTIFTFFGLIFFEQINQILRKLFKIMICYLKIILLNQLFFEYQYLQQINIEPCYTNHNYHTNTSNNKQF